MAVSRRKAVGLVLGTVAGAGAAGFYWMDRKFNPHTPLGYALPDSTSASALAVTPPCDDDEPTPQVTEGPFYTPNTPERVVLREPGTIGTPLVVEGRVLTTDCKPLAGAVLDFWSCDGNGVYDNEGFKLRGHQFSDAAGRFRVETVKPSDYKQFGIHRTAHIHVKVQAHGTQLLTTQLFFPNEPLNAKDWFAKDSLMLDITPAVNGSLLGRFDFVLG